MRKLLLAAIAVLAVGGTHVAFAHTGGSSVTAVTGTFTATTVSKSEQNTCTTSDGKTLQFTNATYTGTATGDASLAGAISLQVRSTIDTTANLGIVQGQVRFGSSEHEGSQAQFTAVYDHGAIAGLATGHGGKSHSLVANVSSSFSPTTGFTNGKIGGSAGGSAVTLGPGKCPSPGSKEDDGKANGHGHDSGHGKK